MITIIMMIYQYNYSSISNFYTYVLAYLIVQQEQTVTQLMQEVLQRHYSGISFTERGAGPALDSDMSYDGFNVTAGINKETGFVYGGNSKNCGTWMNRIGESSLAGNRGVPATPRLMFLCYS